MLAMRGIGVGLGPIIAARLIGPSLSRLLRLCGLAGLVFGACYLGVSVAPTLAIAALFVLLAHLGGGAQWTMSTYGLQVRAPDEIRGRILAADFAFVTLILSVTTTAAGGLASIVGPRPTIATFALLGVLAGTTYLLLTRHLRRQLAQDEAQAAAAAATAAVGGRCPSPGRRGRTVPTPLPSAGQGLLDRLDEGERTDVAVEGRVHPVHHVGEGDLGLRCAKASEPPAPAWPNEPGPSIGVNIPEVMNPMPNVVAKTSTWSGSSCGVTVVRARSIVAGASSRTPSTSPIAAA